MHFLYADLYFQKLINLFKIILKNKYTIIRSLKLKIKLNN